MGLCSVESILVITIMKLFPIRIFTYIMENIPNRKPWSLGRSENPRRRNCVTVDALSSFLMSVCFICRDDSTRSTLPYHHLCYIILKLMSSHLDICMFSVHLANIFTYIYVYICINMYICFQDIYIEKVFYSLKIYLEKNLFYVFMWFSKLLFTQ